jgi:hypothetical protein
MYLFMSMKFILIQIKFDIAFVPNNNSKLISKFDIDINNDELLKTLWKHKRKGVLYTMAPTINLVSTIDILW